MTKKTLNRNEITNWFDENRRDSCEIKAEKFGLSMDVQRKLVDITLDTILDAMFSTDLRNSDPYAISSENADDILDEAGIDVEEIIKTYPEEIDIPDWTGGASSSFTLSRALEVAEFVVKEDLTIYTAQAVRDAIEALYDTDPCSSDFDGVFVSDED